MKSVEEIVISFLNLPADTHIDDNFGVENCSKWDSLAQIGMVVELESAFNTSFTTDEAMNMDTVGGIKAVLKAKGVL
jgi:acyl carrier protein